MDPSGPFGAALRGWLLLAVCWAVAAVAAAGEELAGLGLGRGAAAVGPPAGCEQRAGLAPLRCRLCCRHRRFAAERFARGAGAEVASLPAPARNRLGGPSGRNVRRRSGGAGSAVRGSGDLALPSGCGAGAGRMAGAGTLVSAS